MRSATSVTEVCTVIIICAIIIICSAEFNSMHDISRPTRGFFIIISLLGYLRGVYVTLTTIV